MSKNSNTSGSHSGLSTTFVIVIVSVVVIFALTAVVTIRHISSNYKPSSQTVLKLVRKGKIDEAYAFSEKLDENSVEHIIAKAKVLIAMSLKSQEQDQWRQFGQNPENWLNDDSSRKAVELLEYAVQIDTTAAEAYCMLGVVQKAMGMLESAEQNLHKAILLNTRECDCFLALASLYAMQSKSADAENILRSAANKFPENVSVMKNLGLLYRHYLQKPDSAIVWMNRYLSNTRPDDRAAGPVKQELRELFQRYPEYASVDTSAWGSTRKFTQRKDTPFKK